MHKGHRISGSDLRDNIFPKYCDVHGRINDGDVNNSVSIDGIMSASYREIGKWCPQVNIILSSSVVSKWFTASESCFNLMLKSYVKCDANLM